MSMATVVIPEETILAKIAASDFLPDEARNHMTTTQFDALYGLNALRNMHKDTQMLYRLFGAKSHDSQSLTYSLEYSNSIGPYYGNATNNAPTTKILSYTNHDWYNYRDRISEEQAVNKAWELRNALIAVLENINSNPSADAVAIRDLLTSNDVNLNQIWLKKYFTILFPHKFMTMNSSDWISCIFAPLGLSIQDDWFENAKLFAEKAATFRVDSITLYHVVLACALDILTPELTARGISSGTFSYGDNLLMPSKQDLKKLRKKVNKDELPAWDKWVAEKYDNSAAAADDDTAVTEPADAAPAGTMPTYINLYTSKLLQAKNIIFRGAPGTGKSYLAHQIAAALVSGGVTDEEKKLSNDQKQQIKFVQFHPSYDYSDFVEGLRPVIDTKGQLVFKREDGIFMKFVKVAIDNPDKNYVFIIDEINRGEISKILGELFFSIEPDYRGQKDKGVLTQYAAMHDDPNEKFYIPNNVYIIGTMNDIDRSVDTFDFAMRRRFRFIEIAANDHTEMLDTLPDKALAAEAKKRMIALNKQISEEDLNSNYHIGAAYFLKVKDLDGADPFETLWSDYLEPLLQEYVSGMHNAKESMKAFKKAYDSPVKPADDDGGASEID